MTGFQAYSSHTSRLTSFFQVSRWIAAAVLVILLGTTQLTGSARAYYDRDVDYAAASSSDSNIAYTTPAGPPPPPETAEAEEEDVQPAPLTYIINPGDTLYKIARDFGLSTATLAAYNDISNPNALQVGQKITIPSVPADVPAMDGKAPVIQKVLSSTLTAYTSGWESTGKTPSHPAYGITYSGVKAEEGRTVAVDPAIIPLGSTVYIEGIGIRKAEDTGSAIKGAKIDVYMNDLDQAQTFGVKKNVKVFVLTSA